MPNLNPMIGPFVAPTNGTTTAPNQTQK
jgi:hypothetical protein